MIPGTRTGEFPPNQTHQKMLRKITSSLIPKFSKLPIKSYTNQQWQEVDHEYEPKKRKNTMRFVETFLTTSILLGLGYGAYSLYTNKDQYQKILDDYRDPITKKLLDDHPSDMIPSLIKPTLVINLDDFLIHRQYEPLTGWKTLKRPGADQFLDELAGSWEIIVFSDSSMMNMMAIVDKLDRGRITKALFREQTLYKSGKVIKDLSRLNRPLGRTIMIDWQEDAISLQPENSIKIPRWTGDLKDKTLVELIPFLKHVGPRKDSDFRDILKQYDARDYKVLIEKFKEKQNSGSKTSSTPTSGGGFWDYLGYKK